MARRHFYTHLDDDHEEGRRGDRFTVRLTTRQVAEMVNEMNYGWHRVLSHLVDVRRERKAARMTRYRAEGKHDIAESAEREPDRLADAIEKLLNEGEY